MSEWCVLSLVSFRCELFVHPTWAGGSEHSRSTLSLQGKANVVFWQQLMLIMYLSTTWLMPVLGESKHSHPHTVSFLCSSWKSHKKKPQTYFFMGKEVYLLDLKWNMWGNDQCTLCSKLSPLKAQEAVFPQGIFWVNKPKIRRFQNFMYIGLWVVNRPSSYQKILIWCFPWANY